MIFNKALYKSKRCFVSFLLILAVEALFSPAFAHKRNWLVTYPYWTAVQGELEFEQWHNGGDAVTEDPEELFELEYGVTPRYMTSLYMVRNAGNFKYKAWKWENIYRLANPGEFFVDPALYFEYRNNSATGDPNEFEGKLILQKYLGDLQLTSNLVWEKSLSGDNTSVRFNRYHIAAAYPIYISEKSHDVNLGIEYSRYVEDKVTTLTPGIYAQISHNTRLIAGWEIPVGGNALPRIRTGFEWEFNR